MGKLSEDYPYPFSIYKWLDSLSANHVTLDEHTLENIAFQRADKFIIDFPLSRNQRYQ